MPDIIGSGAEAVVERDGAVARKTRPSKAYRHPDLDRSLRRFRTRREAKVLKRLEGIGPSFVSRDDEAMTVEMGFLAGPQLRDALSEDNALRFAERLGALVRQMHTAKVIHGDLTTSNVLVVDDDLRMIDFGLSFFSDKVEDRAVDLHLLMHALSAKHPQLELWEHVKRGYGDAPQVWERLSEVEMRGRYKQKG